MALATYKFSFLCVACFMLASPDSVFGQGAVEQNAIEKWVREIDREFTAADQDVAPTLRLDELGDPLPPQARFQFGTERFVARRPIFDMALSPDGSVLLTRDADDILCWDASTGKIRWSARVESLWGVGYGLRAFAFNGAGDFVFSQSEPEKLLKWKIATGKSSSITVKNSLPLLPENRPVNAFPGATLAIDVTRDGSRIAAAGGHGVVVYDSAGNSLFEIPNKPNLAIEPTDWHRDALLMGGHYSLAQFSPDGQTLAVLTSEKPQRVRLFNAISGDLKCTVELTSRVVRMAFSPDGTSIGTTERNCAVNQFSTATAERQWRYDPPQTTVVLEPANILRDGVLSTAIAYSPDGKLVAAAGQTQINLLDAATGTLRSELASDSQVPWALAFASDSKSLYSAGLDRFLRRWDVLTSTELPLEKGFHVSGLVASTPFTNRIAFSDSSGNIRLTTASTRPLEKDAILIKTPHARFTALAVSRDGQLVASAANEADTLSITLWNTANGDAVQRWRWSEKAARPARIGTLEFSANGDRLAACAVEHGHAYLLDAGDGKTIAKLEQPAICGLSFDRTGKQLVTAGANERLCFWDAANGDLLRSHEIIGGDLQNVRCSPVDELIVTAHFPNVLRIWNSKDMTLRKRTPLSGEANFDALAFSSDGNWLATGSSGTVNVLNARTAERIWQAGSHHGRVLTLGFAEQDKVIVSGGNDGMVYGWELLPRDRTAARDYDRLWAALANGSDDEIKNVKWELVQIGDVAVDEVERRLNHISRVVDLRAIVKGVDSSTAQSRVRLAMQLCEKNPAVEIDSRVKHAIDLLALLRSPKSIALLKQLATSHESKDIRKDAMFALETIQ
jgi:WD40 repeat protein